MEVKILLTIAVLAIPFIAVLLLAISAWLGWHAVLLNENEIAFVKAGEKVIRLLVNVPGHFANREGKIVPIERPIIGANGEPTGQTETDPDYTDRYGPSILEQWLQDKFGFFWVSAIWPLRRLHKFSIEVERLAKDVPDSKNKSDPNVQKNAAMSRSLGARIENEKFPRIVSSLRFQFPRPFLFTRVEMGKDRLPIDFLVMGNVRITDPRRFVFLLGDSRFRQLKGAVGGRLNDFVKDRDYANSADAKGEVRPGFASEEKGVKSPFAYFMLKGNPDFDETVGAVFEKIWVEEIAIPDDKTREAFEAKKIAELTGDATVAKARKGLEAAKLDAEAAAAPIREKVIAYGGGERGLDRALQDNVTANLSKLTGVLGSIPGVNVNVPFPRDRGEDSRQVEEKPNEAPTKK